MIDERKGPVAIRGDDSKLRTVYGNAFNVYATRDEIILLVGMKEAIATGFDEVTVRLSNRIVLSPIHAKKLLIQLNRLLQIYESQYGSLEVPSPAPTPSTQVSSIRNKPFESPERKPEEDVGLLFRLVESLHVEMGYERSFKIGQATLLKNRFLLGVNKKEIGEGADGRLIEVCRQMGMPKHLLDIFRQCLAQGNYIHFGFEQNEKTLLYKVYLEF